MNKISKYGLLILRDNKFLITREFDTELFLMPGGRPEEGEEIEGCLVREIKEELGCDLKKESLEFFGEFEDVAANEPNTIVNIKLYKGEISGEPQRNSEIEEIKWFGKEDDKEILSAIIKNKIYPAVLDAGLLK